jgi:hypothetical protein
MIDLAAIAKALRIRMSDRLPAEEIRAKRSPTVSLRSDKIHIWIKAERQSAVADPPDA